WESEENVETRRLGRDCRSGEGTPSSTPSAASSGRGKAERAVDCSTGGCPVRSEVASRALAVAKSLTRTARLARGGRNPGQYDHHSKAAWVQLEAARIRVRMSCASSSKLSTA